MKKTLKEQFTSRKFLVALATIASMVLEQESGSQRLLMGLLASVYLVAQSVLDWREIQVAESAVLEAAERIKQTLQEPEA